MAIAIKSCLEVIGTRMLPVVGEALIVEGIFGPAYEQNFTKAQDKGMDPCGCCGRAVKPGSGFVTWALFGNALAPVANWEAMSRYEGDWVAGDLGMMFVGPDCGKKIPAAYRKKNVAGE